MKDFSRPGSTLLCALLLACAHTSNPSAPPRCEDDTECPVGKRCSDGECLSGDQVISQRADQAPVVSAAPEQHDSEPTDQSAPAPEPASGKTDQGIIRFGQVNYVVKRTVKTSTVNDAENIALRERILEAKSALKREPTGKDRTRIIDELMSLCGRQRLRMRELGEQEASLTLALLTLVEGWKYPEYLAKKPKNTSLVAYFPGTEDGGTLYCDKIVDAVDDRRGGVDPFLLQMKFQCEGQELESFLIIEAISDKGGVSSSHKCVELAEAIGGSYKFLLDCLKSRKYD